MKTKLLSKLIFFLAFLLSSSLIIHAIIRMQVARQTHIYSLEIKKIISISLIASNSSLMAPLAVGITGAEYLGSGNFNQHNYEFFAMKVLSVFNELLGITILDHNGKIVRVFPLRDNPRTLGKITQNLQYLKTSLSKNEDYWLSPFQLFQGPFGFTFYVPMINQGKFLGWVAPIISLDRFLKKFIRSEFLAIYHLVIRDDETSVNYFSSSEIIPDQDVHIFKTNIRGRELTFLSWRKEKSLADQAHWPFSLLVSLIMTVIATYAFWLYELKNITRSKLEDINGILKLTVKETTTTLDIIKQKLILSKQMNNPNVMDKLPSHIEKIASMVQQINILQRLLFEKQQEMELVSFTPLLNEAVELLQSSLLSKNIQLVIDPRDFADVSITANKWLFCHSILCNIGYYVIDMASPNSQIRINCQKRKDSYVFLFHIMVLSMKGSRPTTIDFCCNKVIHLHKGNLEFKDNGEQENTVTVILPVS